MTPTAVSASPSHALSMKGGGGIMGPRRWSMKKEKSSHSETSRPSMIRPLFGRVFPLRQNRRSSCDISQGMLPGLLMRQRFPGRESR